MVVLKESGDKDADKVVTLKFFHGGKLVKNRRHSEWSYLGGEVSWFDYCEVDYMSMLKLFGMAKDLRYDNGYDMSFYGQEFGTGRLIQIVSDSTLLARDPKYSCYEDGDSSDLDFEDSDYAQSDEEIDLLKNDDKWFEGYVDHSCTDNDPNAYENDESDNG
ncbi:unnamed protein product [Prunus armeniaca]